MEAEHGLVRLDERDAVPVGVLNAVGERIVVVLESLLDVEVLEGVVSLEDEPVVLELVDIEGIVVVVGDILLDLLLDELQRLRGQVLTLAARDLSLHRQKGGGGGGSQAERRGYGQ